MGYEDALIVFTSDHSWKYDPDLDKFPVDEILHVPLVIKVPNQNTPFFVDETFSTIRLLPIIEQALRGEIDVESVLEVIKN